MRRTTTRAGLVALALLAACGSDGRDAGGDAGAAADSEPTDSAEAADTEADGADDTDDGVDDATQDVDAAGPDIGDVGPDPCDAHLLVKSAAEAGPIVHCVVVKSIHVDLCNGQPDEVVLPALEAATGNFQYCVDDGDTVRAPKLASADVLWLIYAGATDVTVELGGVAVADTLGVEIQRAGLEVSIGGVVSADVLTVQGDAPAFSVEVPDLVALGEITPSDGTDQLVLPLVTSVDRDVRPAFLFFSFLEMPALESVGGDVDGGAPEMQRFLAPKLKTVVGRFVLPAGPFAATPAFPSLETVGSELRIAFPAQCDGAACRDFGTGPAVVDLPALTSAGSLTVTGMPALASLQLPALTAVTGDLTVTDNPLLPACMAEAVALRANPGGAVTTTGNLAGCTCEEADGAVTATCP